MFISTLVDCAVCAPGRNANNHHELTRHNTGRSVVLSSQVWPALVFLIRYFSGCEVRLYVPSSIGGAGYVKRKQLCYLPSHKDPTSLPDHKQISQREPG